MGKENVSEFEENEKRSKSFYENTKTFIFIATTAIGVTLYVHTVFATNSRVDKIEKSQITNGKVNCLIALKIKVDKDDLKDFCDLRIHR